MKKITLLLTTIAILLAMGACAIPGEKMSQEDADLTYELLEAGMTEVATTSNEANARVFGIDLGEDGLSVDIDFDKKIANESGTAAIGISYQNTTGISFTEFDANSKSELKLVFSFRNHKFKVTEDGEEIEVTLNGKFRFDHSLILDASDSSASATLEFSMFTPFPGLHITATKNGVTIIDNYINAELTAKIATSTFGADMEFTGTINEATIKGDFDFDWETLAKE